MRASKGGSRQIERMAQYAQIAIDGRGRDLGAPFRNEVLNVDFVDVIDRLGAQRAKIVFKTFDGIPLVADVLAGRNVFEALMERLTQRESFGLDDAFGTIGPVMLGMHRDEPSLCAGFGFKGSG